MTFLRSLLTPKHPWLRVVAVIVAVAIIVAGGWIILGRGDVLRAQSGMPCSGQYLIDQTLANGARWEMCWEHRTYEGIVFYDVHFTPPGNAAPRRKILAQANIAQIHVPYDDNGARFHDLSDYGLGDVKMNDLAPEDCPGGALLNYAGKDVLCRQVQPRGYAYKYYTSQLQGDQLSLFSVSHIGEYNYIPVWVFGDDGAISPSVGATGRLQRFTNDPTYGWKLSNNGFVDVYGVAHTHNYYWRLDFDVNGTPNDDLVEEFEFTPTADSTKYTISVNPFLAETARTVNPSRMRSWRVRDTNTVNSEGHPISYHLEPMRVGHQHQGPTNEPFTSNQFYVSVANACEKWISHNSGACGENVTDYVNGQSLNGQDVVMWYGISFHHLPRDEDEVAMDAHWDGFSIIPRDWTAQNPLDLVTPQAPTATPTNTPAVPPTATNTPVVPPTATNTPVVPPPATNTPVVPPTATNTPVVPPPATNTPVVPPTATSTPIVPPTATSTPLPVACVVYTSTVAPLPLPNGQSTITSTLVITNGPMIADVDVSFYMTHTWIGDLVVNLNQVSTGRNVTIVDRPGYPAKQYGCSYNNINATLTDEATLPVENQCASTQPAITGRVIPNNLLSAFDNTSSNSTWNLVVRDVDPASDWGVLRTWGLRVCPPGATGITSGSGAIGAPEIPFGEIVPVLPSDEPSLDHKPDGTTPTLFLPQLER